MRAGCRAPVLWLSATLLCRAAAADTAPHSLTALLDGSGFVRIPAGEFVMGGGHGHADERPPHRIRITQPFEIGKFEVTQAQWEAVVRSGHQSVAARAKARANSSRFKGPSLPVESVSWNDVQEFLRALNARDPKYEYRLPTEAEWEYAARAGSSDEAPTSLDAAAWCETNSGGQTHPVGEKQPNARGLHDMLGNVREWVHDWYAPDTYENAPPADPTGPQTGSYRVHRGGGWLDSAEYCRYAVRRFDFPHEPYDSVGFRLVRVPR